MIGILIVIRNTCVLRRLIIVNLNCIIRELQVTDVEKQRLEKRLRASEGNARALSLRAVSLESQLVDREAELRRVESEYHSQM